MNYPNGIKKSNISTNKKTITYKNRGMNLENDINETNKYYVDHKIAFIYKKPTPIKLVKVDYKKGQIKEAYFEKPSTTDYNGLYNGKYIDFEAKETTNKQGFPLANIHKHQINHIRNIYENGGICFIIVRFTSYNETYLLMAKDFLEYIDSFKKSVIPKDYFIKKGFKIKDKFIKLVDYLEVIDQLEGKNEKRRKESNE